MAGKYFQRYREMKPQAGSWGRIREVYAEERRAVRVAAAGELCGRRRGVVAGA